MVGAFIPLMCLMLFIAIAIISAIVAVIYFVIEKQNVVKSMKQKDWVVAIILFFMTMCVLCSIVIIYFLVTPFYLA